MDKAKAIQIIESDFKMGCSCCIHPSEVGWCENKCQSKQAINMAIEALKEAEGKINMSVYIKGEKMPKCCDECWALDDDGDYPRCRITEEQRGYTFRTKEKRMSRCPLVNSESAINQEYDMTCEVAQFILAYMDVHNDLESKAICMAIDALKGKEYD